MSEYNVRTGDNDSSYGTFSTLEAAERALRVVQRLDPEARIVVKYDWQARALMAEAQVQRVREVCDAREEEENDNGGYGKAALVPISDVRDILEVHE